MDQVRKNINEKRKLVDTHVRQLAREHGPVNWYDVAMIMEEMRRDVRVIIDEYIDDPVKRSQAIKMLQSGLSPIQWTGKCLSFVSVPHPRWSQKASAAPEAQGSGRQLESAKVGRASAL